MGRARLGSDGLGLAGLGSAESGPREWAGHGSLLRLARLGSIRIGLAALNKVRLGCVGLELAPLGLAGLDPAVPGSAVMSLARLCSLRSAGLGSA